MMPAREFLLSRSYLVFDSHDDRSDPNDTPAQARQALGNIAISAWNAQLQRHLFPGPLLGGGVNPVGCDAEPGKGLKDAE
jgi:hypothetical protein